MELWSRRVQILQGGFAVVAVAGKFVLAAART